MKKFFILMLLAVMTLTSRAADAEYQYLVFTMTDGTATAVTAANLNISFSDDNLIATSGDEILATLPLTSLAKMEFSTEDPTPTGIQSISVDKLITDDSVTIYDMNGRLIPRSTQLTKGVYIVKTATGKTIKTYIK